MRGKKLCAGLKTVMSFFTVTLLVTSAWAGADQVLHSFNMNGRDGVTPQAGLVIDAAGVIYGTTEDGGEFTAGTVFSLTPPATTGPWTEKILYSFDNNQVDGAFPVAGLIFDAAGKNLYGTTLVGGTHGAGTVFELERTGKGWKEEVLYSFNDDGTDGVNPYASLVFDAAGNLYGTTHNGGDGFGTVFELIPSGGGVWTEKLLHKFQNNGKDGTQPLAGLTFDSFGNLYGATPGGGKTGFGIVFELTPAAGHWTEKVLHQFQNDGEDGISPQSGVILDSAGNLYGMTYGGGVFGYGTVYELIPSAGGSWAGKLLHKFQNNGKDGFQPMSPLIMDRAGNLYGTTTGGGANASGTVFTLVPQLSGVWAETKLHDFKNNGRDGLAPAVGLVFDAQRNLYGTTPTGGAHDEGVVFEIPR